MEYASAKPRRCTSSNAAIETCNINAPEVIKQYIMTPEIAIKTVSKMHMNHSDEFTITNKYNMDY